MLSVPKRKFCSSVSLLLTIVLFLQKTATNVRRRRCVCKTIAVSLTLMKKLTEFSKLFQNTFFIFLNLKKLAMPFPCRTFTSNWRVYFLSEFMGVLSTENRHLNHHKNILILVKVKEKIKYDEMFSSQKRNLRLLINQRKTWRRPSVCFQNGFWLQTCVFKYSWFLIPGNDTSLIPPHQGELEKLWFNSVFTSLDMTYNVYVHG